MPGHLQDSKEDGAEGHTDKNGSNNGSDKKKVQPSIRRKKPVISE
jgi:hypothetical protein